MTATSTSCLLACLSLARLSRGNTKTINKLNRWFDVSHCLQYWLPFKMLSSGFTNAPVSKFLVLYIVASSIALSIFDVKYLVHILVDVHLWRYRQFSRILLWQVAGYANSTEVLFAAILAYNMRVVERLWGSRKLAVSTLIHLIYISTRVEQLLIVFLPDLFSDCRTLHNNHHSSSACPYPKTPLARHLELSTIRAHGGNLRSFGSISRLNTSHIQLPCFDHNRRKLRPARYVIERSNQRRK